MNQIYSHGTSAVGYPLAQARATVNLAMIACLSTERADFVLHRLRTLAQTSNDPTPRSLCSALWREAAYNRALDICAALVADPHAAEQFAALAIRQSRPYLKSKGGQA